MSTWLQLVNQTRAWCGASGSTLATLTGLTGELALIADFVNVAWVEIQSRHPDWGWQRRSTTFPTVAGQAIYPLGSGTGTCNVTAATFGMWDRDQFRTYNTAAGLSSECFMGPPMDYDLFRDTYLFGANRFVSTRPVAIAVAPDQSLCVGPPSVVGYTVEADYFLKPTPMVNDSDVPAMPTEFQMAIVYGAMMSYGAYEAAPEVYQRGQTGYNRLIRQCEANYMPEVRPGGALA